MTRGGKWTRTSSRYLFESRWFNLRQDEVRLPSGQQITYTHVEHPGFVMVVPVLPDGRVVLVRLYRYTLDADSLECPAGGLDGDDPDAAARRELHEETGYTAGAMRPIAAFTASTGISNERFQVFLATELDDTGQTDREATEQMEVVRVPLAEAVQMALGGGISDSASSLALIVADRHLSAR